MPLDKATEARMKQEHFDKYESLAHRIGLDKLIPLVPATRDQIEAALVSGDEHLNTIPLVRWDRAVGVASIHTPVKCECCGQPKPWKPLDSEWRPINPFRIGKSISIAECVCILKHVAVHHIAQVRYASL